MNDSSPPLEIPEASVQALLAEDEWPSEVEMHRALRDIAAPVVATELRRLAALAEHELNGWVRDLIRRSIKDPEGQAYRDADRWDLKFRYHRDQLLARAAELEGGAA